MSVGPFRCLRLRATDCRMCGCHPVVSVHANHHPYGASRFGCARMSVSILWPVPWSLCGHLDLGHTYALSGVSSPTPRRRPRRSFRCFWVACGVTLVFVPLRPSPGCPRPPQICHVCGDPWPRLICVFVFSDQVLVDGSRRSSHTTVTFKAIIVMP